MQKLRDDKTTIQKGNAFRDLVASMLEASGFVAETETRERFKKVDVRWRREDLDGPLKYVVEAKDHAGTLGMQECREFLTDYGSLVESRDADRAWLVSKSELSPDGRALVDNKSSCKAMTFVEFQRRLLGLDSYLHDLIDSFTADKIAEWYVPLHTDEGRPLETVVREWIDETDAPPLAIVAGYGKGKSTFARHFSASLAREALDEPWRRVPVLVPLGDIVDEQSLEGLLGKVFTTRPGVRGYNFGLFEKLNNAGRYIVIFDGFDEMKHGMTLARFEANIAELMRLDKDAAKLIILGRDTAFQDDYEFRSIINGRQVTAGGQEVSVRGRRPFRQLTVRNFAVDEAKTYVTRFFPIVSKDSRRGSGGPVDETWISTRLQELLSGTFDELLVRPVHAQMLCQIATDPHLSLVHLSKYRLFDQFVHFLLDREVSKRGRNSHFSLHVRRQFNRALAFWLWSQGGISTVTLSSVPADICRTATSTVRHDYDDTALRKELTAGCLIEKGATGTIYFGHRSLQEFLIAEYLVETNFEGILPEDKSAALWMLGLITPEVSSFIVEAAKSSTETRKIVLAWFDILKNLYRNDMPHMGMRFLMELYDVCEGAVARLNEPWFIWLRYFVANRAVEFKPKADSAADPLNAALKYLGSDNKEQQIASLMLLVKVLQHHSDMRNRLGLQLIAKWLDPALLRNAVNVAKKLGRQDHHYIARDENPALWTFLHAVKFEGTPLRIIVDLQDAHKRLNAYLPMGFAEEQDEHVPENLRYISTEPQAIYRAWDLRESELEKLRPYFGDSSLRAKVLPLEVVHPQREVPKAGPPRKLTAREVLSLRKPGRGARL